MNAIQIYDMLLDLISQKATSMHITEEELSQYYIPEGTVFNQNYLERLASSLQNSGMMHNSIRFNESEERYQHIKTVLCNFHCEKVIKKYQSWQELYNALTNHGSFDKGPQKDTPEKRTNWGKYAKGLFDGVTYLSKEGGAGQIAALCSEPATPEELDQKINALRQIEQRIHGLGFALCCDWLKECGCVWLAKPDTHIKIVCSAMLGREEENLISDIETIRFVYHLTNEIKQKYPDATAYKVDKLIWLICTGNFYLQKDKIGRDTILSLLKS